MELFARVDKLNRCSAKINVAADRTHCIGPTFL